MTEIPCLLFETDDKEHEAQRAELAAISSNLGRRDLPAAVRAVELARYKAAVEDLNRATGANVDPSADLNDVMSASTRGLMSAVSSLPQLTERKRVRPGSR